MITCFHKDSKLITLCWIFRKYSLVSIEINIRCENIPYFITVQGERVCLRKKNYDVENIHKSIFNDCSKKNNFSIGISLKFHKKCNYIWKKKCFLIFSRLKINIFITINALALNIDSTFTQETKHNGFQIDSIHQISF